MKLGELLVTNNFITQGELDQALDISRTTRKRLGEVCIDNGHITQEQLVQCLSKQGFSIWDGNKDIIDFEVLKKFDFKYLYKNGFIPYKVVGRVSYAITSDPINLDVNNHIKKITASIKLELILATKDDVKATLDVLYEDNKTVISKRTLDDIRYTGNNNVFLKAIIKRAVEEMSTDIHMDFDIEGKLFIKIRSLGVLRTIAILDYENGLAFIRTVKTKSGMSTDSKQAQDGRLSETIRELELDVNMRISAVPTVVREETDKVVIRIHGSSRDMLTLSKIGYESKHIGYLKQQTKKKRGLSLLVGPTGNGKNTTIYAILDYLNNGQRNIVTIEEPAEILIDGVNQYKIDQHNTIENAMKTVVRQDPDVIYVGEIRDLNTAELAISSANTGHLVFSTLHSKDSATAVLRLVGLGSNVEDIADVLNYIIYQKLVRVLCPECKVKVEDQDSLNLAREKGLDIEKLYTAGDGCLVCKDGHIGLKPVYEILNIDENNYENILNKDIKALRNNLMLTLEDSIKLTLENIEFEDIEFVLIT